MLMDIIRGILGLGPAAPKDDFANISPDDIEGFWRADHDIDQAERAGNIEAGYAKYGVKNADHWDNVRASFHRRHGHTPEYSLAASTANFKAGLEDLKTAGDDGRANYQLPAGYLDPVEGISLDKFAVASVRTEGCSPADRDAVLSQMGYSPAQYETARGVWSQRISGGGDPIAGAMLSGLWHTYQAQVRAVYAR